jgi:hypothetical protein
VGALIRKLDNANLGLTGELWGAAPVQALGAVNGREFYFRARHNEWTFEIARDSGSALPSDGGPPGFLRSARFPNASFMPLSTAEALIVECVESFLIQGQSGAG